MLPLNNPSKSKRLGWRERERKEREGGREGKRSWEYKKEYSYLSNSLEHGSLSPLLITIILFVTALIGTRAEQFVQLIHLVSLLHLLQILKWFTVLIPPLYIGVLGSRDWSAWSLCNSSTLYLSSAFYKYSNSLEYWFYWISFGT